MSGRSDYVAVEVNGVRLNDWLEYSVDSDILTPTDAFSMKLGVTSGSDASATGGGANGAAQRRAVDRMREICAPLSTVELFVGASDHPRSGALIFTGRIDRRHVHVSQEQGTTITIEGRDTAAYLVDSAAPIGLVRSLGEEVTFSSLARAAVAPWNIQVISESSTMREITTGLAASTPAQRLIHERAIREGIAAARISGPIVREAQRTGTPLTTATAPSPPGGRRPTQTLAQYDAGVRAMAARADRARRLAANGMIGSDVEQITVNEASPRPGESVWTFLARHAERLGFLMFMDPRGRLVLGPPDYGSDALYRFVHRYTSEASDPNNVLSIDVEESSSQRLSRVKVLGRTHGRGAARERVRAVIEDDGMPFVRERTERDHSVRTTEQAQRIAKRLIREGVAGAEVITVHAPDHGQGRYLYTTNVTAEVLDETGGIDGRRYITSRTFTRSREQGTSTELRLVQCDSLTL